MISVCMATFNGSRFIEGQMKSILNQSLTADEVIIQDDVSSDDTVNKISSFIKENNLEDKWKLIVNDTNLGYPSNFYSAISKCRGSLIFLSDQDDIWALNKIESMTKIMNENPQINLLSCKHEIIDETNNKINTLMSPKNKRDKQLNEIDLGKLFKSFNWPGMTMVFRNSFFKENCYGLINTKINHDFGLAFLASDIDSFYFYNYLGAYHRRHNNNVGLSEHRITELLRLRRKLRDLNKYNVMLKNIIESNFNISENSSILIKEYFMLSELRYRLLNERDRIGIIKYYISNKDVLRIKSMIADIWIVFFDKNKNKGEFYD